MWLLCSPCEQGEVEIQTAKGELGHRNKTGQSHLSRYRSRLLLGGVK
jgi:hypothetical protein